MIPAFRLVQCVVDVHEQKVSAHVSICPLMPAMPAPGHRTVDRRGGGDHAADGGGHRGLRHLPVPAAFQEAGPHRRRGEGCCTLAPGLLQVHRCTGSRFRSILMQVVKGTSRPAARATACQMSVYRVLPYPQ